MLERLTTYSIFRNWQTPLLLIIFFTLRITSFYLSPHPIIQAILVFFFIFILGLVFFKNPDWAWMIILGEIILGGAGHYLEFFGLSIRTVLILVFLFLWIVFAVTNRDKINFLKIPGKLFYVLLPLGFFLLISTIAGLFNGHQIQYIIQDLIPFSFLILLLPAYHLFKNEKIKHYFIRLCIVFLIGSMIFSLVTFFFFTTGVAELHDPFYNWFRDVTMGKITHVTDFYYRVVTPAHLLITPILLMICALLMRDEKHHYMWRFLFFCGALVLALDFSRVYLLAFAVGLLFLKYKHKFHRWIKVSLWSLSIIALMFISINIISSGFRSFGLEIIGIRISSFAAPEVELSTATRMVLLDPIFSIIKQHPIIGSGLGATVIYLHPATYEQVTTRSFDWGYLEMWAELGLFGGLWLLIIVGVLIFELIKKIRKLADYHDFYIGLLGGIISMLIINITTSALTHVLGIFYLAFVIAFVSKPVTIFDGVVTILYRIFNRLKQR